jgi:hypothetical protein
MRERLEYTYGSKGSLQEIAHGCSRALRLRVAILNTGELKETLRCRSGDNTSPTRSRDQSAHDGTDLSADLRWHCVRLTKGRTPVTSPHGNDGKFGEDDGASNGSRNFFSALNTQSNMSVRVTDSNEGLEAGTLTGTSLLLHRHDLHDLILELGQEEVDDLVFLDGKGEEINFFHRFDFTVLDETAEFSDGSPARPCYWSSASKEWMCTHHSFSSSLRPPLRGPRRPLPRSPLPRPNPPRPRAASAIIFMPEFTAQMMIST